MRCWWMICQGFILSISRVRPHAPTHPTSVHCGTTFVAFCRSKNGLLQVPLFGLTLKSMDHSVQQCLGEATVGPISNTSSKAGTIQISLLHGKTRWWTMVITSYRGTSCAHSEKKEKIYIYIFWYTVFGFYQIDSGPLNSHSTSFKIVQTNVPSIIQLIIFLAQ